MRQTSAEAYNAIKENGLLSKFRWATYDFLFHNGPLTTRGVHAGVKQIAKDVGIVSSRLTELREMGVVREVGLKVCDTTGMTVTLWDVTAKLPMKLKRPIKILCRHCNGKGFFLDKQERLF